MATTGKGPAAFAGGLVTTAQHAHTMEPVPGSQVAFREAGAVSAAANTATRRRVIIREAAPTPRIAWMSVATATLIAATAGVFRTLRGGPEFAVSLIAPLSGAGDLVCALRWSSTRRYRFGSMPIRPNVRHVGNLTCARSGEPAFPQRWETRLILNTEWRPASPADRHINGFQQLPQSGTTSF